MFSEKVNQPGEQTQNRHDKTEGKGVILLLLFNRFQMKRQHIATIIVVWCYRKGHILLQAVILFLFIQMQTICAYWQLLQFNTVPVTSDISKLLPCSSSSSMETWDIFHHSPAGYEALPSPAYVHLQPSSFASSPVFHHIQS